MLVRRRVINAWYPASKHPKSGFPRAMWCKGVKIQHDIALIIALTTCTTPEDEETMLALPTNHSVVKMRKSL